MPRITLDYETRSRAPLERVGSAKYSHDSTTAVDVMAYKVDSNPVEYWLEGEPQPEVFRQACGDPEWEFHAFNAAFEIDITAMLGRRKGWAVPDLTQWRCTQAKAGHANLPLGLGACSAALRLPDNLGKDPEGHKLMLKTCKPDGKGRWIWQQKLKKETEKEFQQRLQDTYSGLFKYCGRDVVAEDIIDRITPPWPDEELAVWQVHHKINTRGIPIDLELCEAAVGVIEELRERNTRRLHELSGGEITTGNQVQRLLKFVNERGLNIDNMRKETVADALDQRDLDAEVVTALEARQAVSSAAASKYKAAVDMEWGGLVRGQFTYYGASTGRWSGRGLQVHNLKKGTPDEQFIDTIKTGDVDLIRALYGSPIQKLGEMCRGIIQAPPGRMFAMADFSQIEARVVHWLAGDKDTLADFREQDRGDGPDKYQKMAAVIYGVSASSIGKGTKRNAGKAVVLGAGYGMGGPRFQDYALTYGVTFSENEARSVIDKYRRAHPAIPRLWSNYEQAAIRAVRGHPTSAGRCKFYTDKEWLVVQLPSGRRLYYHRPDFGPAPNSNGNTLSYIRRGARVVMWGGVFTENITQAVSRDILAESLLALDRSGFDICLHVHDEVVDECASDEAADALGEIENIMRTNPEWCKDIPLFSEGDTGKRFKK